MFYNGECDELVSRDWTLECRWVPRIHLFIYFFRDRHRHIKGLHFFFFLKMLSSQERLHLVLNTVQSGSRDASEQFRGKEVSGREGGVGHQDIFSSFTQPLVMICLLYGVVFSPDCSELRFIPWHCPVQKPSQTHTNTHPLMLCYQPGTIILH